jgi:hypothetical protein
MHHIVQFGDKGLDGIADARGHYVVSDAVTSDGLMRLWRRG